MKGPTEAARSDWILLTLCAAKGHRLTAVTLQKSLFLLGAQRPDEVGRDYYRFQPYHYGPFDAEVYHDAEALERGGLIEVDASHGRQLRQYGLTPAGEAAATDAAKRQSKKGQAYLTAVVEWAQPLPFHVLVRAIYDAFPAMRVNSIFEDQA